MPWWAKIAIKIVLSRIPLGYGFFSRVGLFRHGKMDDPGYALQVFRRHFDRSDFSNKNGGYTALELGPGDSFVSAIIADAHGAAQCYMVDAGRYAVDSVPAYRSLIEGLRSAGVNAREVADCASAEELLSRVDGIYLTDGLQSLRSIPDDSVDFVWSQAVLEHIRLSEFDETLLELRRVMKPSGMASHRVDLQDHLGGSLNNLRFSQELWEADWMAKSGFYTNRIRYEDMIERFKHAGFDYNILAVDRWDTLPVPRESISGEFSTHSDDDLRVSGFDVVLRKQ